MYPVVHLELHTRDRRAATEFYTRLLDWQPRASLAQMLPAIVDDYVTRYGVRAAPAEGPLPSAPRRAVQP